MMARASLRFSDYSPLPALDVAIHREPAQGDISAHAHQFVELAFIEGGEAVHETEGTLHPVKRGDVLILHGNRYHGYRDTRQFSLANVLVRERFVQQASAELSASPAWQDLFGLQPLHAQMGRYTSRVRLGEARLRQSFQLIREIETHTQPGASFGAFRANACLRLLLCLVLEAYDAAPRLDRSRTSGLAAAIAEIESAPLDPISLTRLARVAGMSERTLLRRFRQATGFSPIDLHLRSRLRRAADLLRTSTHAIGLVAELCGFDDSNYFSRQFRRIYGCSPSEWREPDEKRPGRSSQPGL